ncbi:MAG: NADH-quinone oxidoreductase subunit L [Pseudomonadales bacterium]
MSLLTLQSLLLLSVPALLLLGGAFSSRAWRWRAAETTSVLALAAAIAAAVLAGLLSVSDPAGGWRPLGLLSPAPLSLVMLLLITFIGLVVVRYSHTCLSGESREASYVARLHVTLAAVTIVVLTDHLLVLLGGWLAISLGLHQLLLFYPERSRAALAAHKKFLLARLAELALLCAALLLYSAHGTWHISEIVAHVGQSQLSGYDQAAALLIALAALIKCAQLPVHGWLIQVVEAPTPVSALLHAGIINLGGYLLILFAPLFSQAVAAQWLVLVVAGLTTVLAALIMGTRVSVKVKLAWSTSAQMGLMLVECALGLYQLALLHLVAHGCYKAYSFLDAGSAAEQALTRRLAPVPASSRLAWLRGAVWALPLVLMGLMATGTDAMQAPLSVWLLLAAALTLLLGERGLRGAGTFVPALGLALALVLAYLAQKHLAGVLVPAVAVPEGWLPDIWVGLLVTLLIGAYWLLRFRPDGVPARRLSEWLFAGLYLDEWFTRTTLRLWPVQLPVRRNPKRLDTQTEETAR